MFMSLYKSDKIYPIDVMKETRDINVKDNSNDWKYVVGFFAIMFLIFIILIINVFKKDDNKNLENINEENSVISNMNDSIIENVVETEDGYKKEYIYYTIVKEKKVVITSTGSRMYLISCEDESIDEYEFIEIGVQLYNQINLDDSIKITRTIFYNKKDEKLYHEDLVEKINMF